MLVMNRVPLPEVVNVSLLPKDVEVLDQWRGGLSRDDFLLALFRICTSDRVSSLPNWVRGSATKNTAN